LISTTENVANQYQRWLSEFAVKLMVRCSSQISIFQVYGRELIVKRPAMSRPDTEHWDGVYFLAIASSGQILIKKGRGVMTFIYRHGRLLAVLLSLAFWGAILAGLLAVF
jgi:hypothetical protein